MLSCFSVALPFSLFLSASLGFLFAYALVHNAHLCFGAQIVLAQLFALLPSVDDNVTKRELSVTDKQKPIGDDAQKGRQISANLVRGHADANYIAPSWERIEIDARLNRELEELFETLLESYVSSWSVPSAAAYQCSTPGTPD